MFVYATMRGIDAECGVIRAISGLLCSVLVYPIQVFKSIPGRLYR